jgi:formylglycine-generating enzyme required for sulfatase activity/proteasome lid subunit RPN8/RPN11
LTSQDNAIVLSPVLRERLLTTIRQRYPQKSFGYLLSDVDACTPTDFILFNTNIRNSETWKTTFESYGQYFVEHEDAGFVATPEESWQVQNEIWQRGMVEVGVFHSHLRHPANFSGIDFDLHTQRFDNLWHLIISMRNPHLPQLRAFAVSPAGVRELPLVTPAGATPGRQRSHPSSHDRTHEAAVIAQARQLLRLDSAGLPLSTDNSAIFAVMRSLFESGQSEALTEFATDGFLRESAQRFAQYIAPHMQHVAGGSFQMGAPAPHTHGRHFCGETPAHTVEVAPFSIMRVPITHELFGLFDRRRLDVPARDLQKPATGLTWFDAVVFALWMGCRLPTEAQWEYACGAGSAGEWCCQDERLLSRYAWYSENARGSTQTVGTREANAFGLYDFHGNVWEWCQDTYEQDFYARSPRVDPVNTTLPFAQQAAAVHKVCRGGSLHALSEMCRTRYRFHEPADFLAQDLGCRLARNVDQASTKGKMYG